MSKFLTELHLCPHEECDKFWLLKEPLVYQSDLVAKNFSYLSSMLGKGIFHVPVGFCTDLASTQHIPFVNWIWGGKAHREAVVHDYLYAIGAEPEVTRTLADDIFFEAMECRGKPAWVRYPMYWGVVCGGWAFYKKTLVKEC